MTARTAAIIFLLFLASLAIQGSVLALAAPGGVHPDILLVVTVALSALAGPRRGAITGLCGTDAGYSFRFTLGFLLLSRCWQERRQACLQNIYTKMWFWF